MLYLDDVISIFLYLDDVISIFLYLDDVISIFLYLDDVIFRLLHSLKYQRSTTSGYIDIGIKIRVCDKNSIPLQRLQKTSKTFFLNQRF